MLGQTVERASGFSVDQPAQQAPLSETATQVAGLELAVVSTRDGFDRLEAEWNALFARAGRSTHVFQQFNWNWHWANHFLHTDDGRVRLAIVTGRRNGELVMVWPLVIERLAGLRVLAWMGEPVSQYGDVLVENGPDRFQMLQSGWHHIKVHLRPDVLRLNKTRADSAIAPLLADIGAISTQRLEAPFLDLASAPTFAIYEQRYANKARKNRQRLARRLKEMGDVSFHEFREGAQAAAIARKAIAMKRLWLAEKGLISPALSDARTLAFFAAAAGDDNRPTNIKVATLMCGGRLAAVEIGFGCRDRAAIHIMAYDLEFDKAAAGILLLEHRIEQSLADKVAVYDLLAPGDGYKKEWADGAVRVDDFAVPVTMLGRGYAHGYLGFVRPQIKAAIARIPQSTRKAWSQRLTAALAPTRSPS